MGSGGGGSSSGKTDYPDYMKSYHRSMLGVSDGANLDDNFALNIIEALNAAASGNSPYFAYTSNQLTADKIFFATGKAVTDSAYAKPFDLLAALADFDFDATLTSNITGVSTESWKTEIIQAQVATLDDEINTNINPEFDASMREIGAVMSSAFVIGKTLMQGRKLAALAKTRLDVEQISLQREEVALRITVSQHQARQIVLNAAADLSKYYHTIKAEIDDTNAEFVAKDMLWDLKLFQYAANPLGAISGSALAVDSGKGSKVGGAISGAMAGAAAGAMIGSVVPGVGTAIGAVAGGVMGLAGGLA